MIRNEGQDVKPRTQERRKKIAVLRAFFEGGDAGPRQEGLLEGSGAGKALVFTLFGLAVPWPRRLGRVLAPPPPRLRRIPPRRAARPPNVDECRCAAAGRGGRCRRPLPSSPPRS